MRRNAFLLFAATATLFGAAAPNAADFPGGTAFNLPGIRYCAAPDCDNSAFLDTYYSIDAGTGKLTAHTASGTVEVDGNSPRAGETTLFAAPPSRPVPPVRADNALATPYPGTAFDPYITPAPGPTGEDEKIPWWKGGMWRNKKDGDDSGGDRDRDESDSSPSRSSSSRSPSSDSSASSPDSRASSAFDDDDMWGDESDDEYSGYNPDGTFGRPAGQEASGQPAPRQPANNSYGGDPYAADSGYPAGGVADPASAYSDPYAAPYPAPYPDPYASTQPMTTGGTYADPYAGSVYQSSPVDTSMYGGTTTYNDAYSGGTYYDANAYGAAVPYDPGAAYGGAAYTDPSAYGAPSYDAQGYAPAPPPGGGADPFANAPPSYQAEPSIDAQGSPQFENAVRLVKDNRFSEAKGILTSETGRNPSNASAWRWLADCHYNLLELDDAINSYQRALEVDPNDYYALRGQGFSYLHRGHEYWRQMQEQVGRGQKDAAATTFAQAHDSYKKSLELLGLCLRRAPNDGETVYGEAMAAEGASRKLYSNAISYLKLGPEQRERAELFAENCVTVINKGIERSKERAKQNPGDAGPRALLGGLYLRKAILYRQLGKNDLALIELRNSRDVQSSILDEIDKNNLTAQKNLRESEAYWEEWGGNRQ
ncbi:MAG: tetratricopeptide repeat protein [Planctomycetota bacterium]|nr:tetratricopeptide repeat protein [Planctomycetota bacterium]